MLQRCKLRWCQSAGSFCSWWSLCLFLQWGWSVYSTEGTVTKSGSTGQVLQWRHRGASCSGVQDLFPCPWVDKYFYRKQREKTNGLIDYWKVVRYSSSPFGRTLGMSNIFLNFGSNKINHYKKKPKLRLQSAAGRVLGSGLCKIRRIELHIKRLPCGLYLLSRW